MRAALLLVVACCVSVSEATASVFVVTNRTDRTVEFRLSIENKHAGRAENHSIQAGDCRPIPLSDAGQLQLEVDGRLTRYRVSPGAIYYVGLDAEKNVTFGEIGLELPQTLAEPPPLTAAGLASDRNQDGPAVVSIPVKILFDGAEILTEKAWETRMRRRFDDVSRIFREHCFVEFKIVLIDTWHPPASTDSLAEALARFERMVDPAPGQLAIGFLAKRIAKPQDGHLGGTRGALCTHVLIHERANQNTERECLELLVHELGHFLGAAHSPEKNSVMRPILGDRFARSPHFQIVFDPLNTMAMCVVSSELGINRHVQVGAFSAASTKALKKIYFNLDRTNPKDPAAGQYLKMLSGNSGRD